MKFYLIVAKGKKQGLPIPIDVDLFLIGSGKMCQLRAVHDDIGEQHCALVMRGRKVFVRDLGSGHDTIVNGEEVPVSMEWPIHAGDFLEVGPLQFMIQYREKALSQKDLEEWALRCLDDNGDRKATPAHELDEWSAKYTEESENASRLAGLILDRMNAKKGVVKGRLRISREGNVTIVRINDLFLVEEAELAFIKKELHDNLNGRNLKILLDLKNVKRMSSAAAEMFGELKHWLRPMGSRIAMCRMKPEHQQMILNFPACDGIKFFNDKPQALAGTW